MAIREYIRESKGLPAERARFTSYQPKPPPKVDSRPFIQDGRRVAQAFISVRTSAIDYELDGLATWFSQVLSGRSPVPACYAVTYNGDPEQFGKDYALAANVHDAKLKAVEDARWVEFDRKHGINFTRPSTRTTY